MKCLLFSPGATMHADAISTKMKDVCLPGCRLTPGFLRFLLDFGGGSRLDSCTQPNTVILRPGAAAALLASRGCLAFRTRQPGRGPGRCRSCRLWQGLLTIQLLRVEVLCVAVVDRQVGPAESYRCSSASIGNLPTMHRLDCPVPTCLDPLLVEAFFVMPLCPLIILTGRRCHRFPSKIQIVAITAASTISVSTVSR